jgi:katanin p60 ATPase-containing subunit A1
MHLPGERAEGIDYHSAASMLEGYSGSDIKLVCKEAAMKTLRRLLLKLE